MPAQDVTPDLSHYTSLRYPGSAAKIIRRFAVTARALSKRLGRDVQRGRRGEYGSERFETLRASVARSVQRSGTQIDLLERVLLDAPGESGRVTRNVFANVVFDTNFEEFARTHTDSPPQIREGKFDQELGGFLQGFTGDIADKLWQLVDVLASEFPGAALLLNFISVILRDYGLSGKLAEGPTRDEIHEQLENKLHDLLVAQGDLGQGQRRIASIVELIETLVGDVRAEVNKIEQKADTLANLLGKTLMSEAWIVDPTKNTSGNKTPQKGVKEELHEIEDILKYIVQVLPPLITDGPYVPPPPPDGGPPPSFDHPPPENPPVVRDARLKKIFVYAENKFRPKSKADRRTIRVRTPAFDLTGWLDLTELRLGDEIEVQVRVSFAGKKRMLFATTLFSQPGLKSFSELARGLNYISGNDIELRLRQTNSKNNFSTRITIRYQFVVESQ